MLRVGTISVVFVIALVGSVGCGAPPAGECAGASCDGGIALADGCVPACTGLECGADPVCGAPCGSCASGACSEGRCAPADAPRILSSAASSMRVTPTRPVTLSVVVTDPDGIDDLVGGTLVDTAGRAYGTFATDAAEGSYSLVVTWALVETIESIDTGPAERTAERSLVARFFDVEGNSVERRFVLTLQCDEPSEAPCGGTCVDRGWSDEHCGACGFTCDFPARCTEGMCEEEIRGYGGAADTTCASLCEGIDGMACDDELTSISTRYHFAAYDIGCSMRSERCDDVIPGRFECADGPRERGDFGCLCRHTIPTD